MNTKKHSRQKYHALILATAILTLNFWAWSLLSPLATTYKEIFQLSPVAVSFLIATPVLIGALGRIPVGLLTDRYGGRAVFFWICLLTAMSVAGLAFTSDPNILFLLAGAIGVTSSGPPTAGLTRQLATPLHAAPSALAHMEDAAAG